MNLASMRSKLVSLSANTLSASNTTALDELLNGAYQSTLPGLLTGESTEGYWDLTTVASTGEYAYPNWLVAPHRKNPRFTTSDQYELGFSTRPDVFWSFYDLDDVTEGRPSDGLFYGRTVTLRPIPNAVYTIRVWGRIGKSDALDDTTDYERNEAMACVALAAIEHSELTGNAEVMEAATSVYERHFDVLQTHTFTRSRGPAARVSF